MLPSCDASGAIGRRSSDAPVLPLPSGSDASRVCIDVDGVSRMLDTVGSEPPWCLRRCDESCGGGTGSDESDTEEGRCAGVLGSSASASRRALRRVLALARPRSSAALPLRLRVRLITPCGRKPSKGSSRNECALSRASPGLSFSSSTLCRRASMPNDDDDDTSRRARCGVRCCSGMRPTRRSAGGVCGNTSWSSLPSGGDAGCEPAAEVLGELAGISGSEGVRMTVASGSDGLRDALGASSGVRCVAAEVSARLPKPKRKGVLPKPEKPVPVRSRTGGAEASDTTPFDSAGDGPVAPVLGELGLVSAELDCDAATPELSDGVRGAADDGLGSAKLLVLDEELTRAVSALGVTA